MWRARGAQPRADPGAVRRERQLGDPRRAPPCADVIVLNRGAPNSRACARRCAPRTSAARASSTSIGCCATTTWAARADDLLPGGPESTARRERARRARARGVPRAGASAGRGRRTARGAPAARGACARCADDARAAARARARACARRRGQRARSVSSGCAASTTRDCEHDNARSWRARREGAVRRVLPRVRVRVAQVQARRVLLRDARRGARNPHGLLRCGSRSAT